MENHKRVVYAKSPLVEVILQVRFPTILAINAKEPAEFQDKIRARFPIYQLVEENEQEISIFPVMDGHNPPIVNKNQYKNHNFVSQDWSAPSLCANQ